MEYLLMKYSQHHAMNKDSGGKRRREIKRKQCPKAPESRRRRWPWKAVQRKKNMNGRQ